jgi:hypothetical protein
MGRILGHAAHVVCSSPLLELIPQKSANCQNWQFFHRINSMPKKKHKKSLTMQGPAIYRIRVQGQLDARLSDRIGGMQITEVRGTQNGPETILVGRIVDQASLSGILNSLYELHLPVLSAECIDAENDSTSQQENENENI